MKASLIILITVSILFFAPVPLLSQSGTFTVYLPKIEKPHDYEGQGWSRPNVWGKYDNSAKDDSIVVPDGRPIYALIVSGYAQNSHFDQLMVYKFARHLMEHRAYVHYAWWNNLLAPYMERPLHYLQSNPGNLGQDFTKFTTAESAQYKAIPGEDYQFLEDAKLFLSAIRQHNPDAIIIVVGHSMGGGAVVHLASQTKVRINILGLIDPVGNRNFPFAGDRPTASDYNWTRWRITRSNFLGYKSWKNNGTILNPTCVPDGPWLSTFTAAALAISSPECKVLNQGKPYIDNSSTLTFGSNVVHLYYRFQKEFLFPFDYSHVYYFNHTPPSGFTRDDEQHLVQTKSSPLQSDPGGWPLNIDPNKYGGCAVGNGVGWPHDGHGEIVGYRGPLPTVPLGVRVRTSPDRGTQCGNKTWPWRTQDSNGGWIDPNASVRRNLLIALEKLPADSIWANRPTNPDLCLVSDGLINLFDGMVTDVKTNTEIPKFYLLEQNYPNPFNPTTVLKYEIPKSSNVKLTIYNELGQLVKTLVNEEKSPGTYSVNFNAGSLSSGIYFYTIKAGDFYETKKMILLK
ncbi:MAG: alpha/beta fold hydrolase [Ignavibacteriaceae bacterium]